MSDITGLRYFVLLLDGYLRGAKTLLNIEEWLAGVNWDDPMPDELKDILGMAELLATEIGEGFRPESEFRKWAVAMMGGEPKPEVITYSGSDGTVTMYGPDGSSHEFLKTSDYWEGAR